MRFYRIVPNGHPVGLLEQHTHWLPPGQDRWTDLTLYTAACGRSGILGHVILTYHAEEVTCEECHLKLLAQFLADEEVKDTLEAAHRRKAGAAQGVGCIDQGQTS